LSPLFPPFRLVVLLMRDISICLISNGILTQDNWDRESPKSEAEQYDEIITAWIEGGPEPREVSL
jgi:hypothetical protein